MARKHQPGCPCCGNGCQWFCSATVTFQASVNGTAVGSLTITDGMVSAITITNPGNYPNTLHPTVTISPPPAGGTQAHATATTGGLRSASVTNGGQNYTVASVTFSAPPAGGITATGQAVIGANGSIARIIITDRGGGYSGNPTVTITGDGVGATASAIAAVGQITSTLITDPGSGYVSPSPVPTQLVLTMSGNGVTYGPFTLVRTASLTPFYCDWSSFAPITVPATQSCPEFNTSVQMSVSRDGTGWAVVADFLVGITLATGNCSGLLGYSCLHAGSGQGTTTTISGLLPCPYRPFSAVLSPAYLASPDFFNFNAAILFLVFGGYCNGNTPVPARFPVTFALSEP